ncbi:hypothetical protein C8R47DRAFT_1312837 [Mycena vitilis]|nr:hypothetical protein C8R47DRAFT_1312837 [Mycena vitilis]
MAAVQACVCGFRSLDDSPPLRSLPAAHTLLTHNDPPAPSEIPPILDFLVHARARRDSLDSKIRAVAAILDSLVKDRDLVAEDIRSHTAVISPVRQMPTEILCRIFLAARKPLAYMELAHPPWYLGQVCKRWREIALALPLLWSSFGVAKKIRKSVQSPCAPEGFQEQFRRAGNAPLDVTIQGSFDRLDGPLRDACERWQSLSTDDFYSHMELREIRDRVPMLRRIQTIQGRRITECEFSAPFPGICDLASSSSNSPWTSLPMRWEHLTRYDGPVEWATHLDILRQATHLVECRIDICTVMETTLPDDILRLPNLRRFSVSQTHTLKYIDAPGLQELAIDGECTSYCTPDAGDLEHVVDFLRRARCTLVRLSLLCLIPTSEVFLAVPSLRELTLTGRPRASMLPVVQSLFPAQGTAHPTTILPNLTAFSVGASITAHLPLGLAIKLAIARSEGTEDCRRLEFFGILVDTSKSPSRTAFTHTPLMRQLAAVQRAGLELCIVKGEEKYNRVQATDPYSIRRCAECRNPELTRSELWEWI